LRTKLNGDILNIYLKKDIEEKYIVVDKEFMQFIGYNYKGTLIPRMNLNY